MEQNKIKLNSSSSFVVYRELSFVDRSLDIEKAKVVSTAQLIRVLPTFTANDVRIRKGTHVYDASILDWPTIRQFIKQGVIDPVGFSLEDYINKQEVKEAKKKAVKVPFEEEVKEPVEAPKKKVAKTDKPSLGDMAD